MRFEEIKDMAKKYKPLIDREMLSVIPREGVENFHDAMHYHLSTGGKRIRPLLAILTTKALGGDVNKTLPFAAACELLHNWLLIHDDIEDGDTVRRGKPTVWAKYGIPHAINVGDGMAHYAMKALLKCKERGVDNETVFRLLDSFLDTAIKTAEGQAMELNLRKNNNPSEQEYMKMIIGKTAYYLTIPMVGGAIIAGAGDALVEKIIEYGKNVGPAFQIRDDVLDLSAGKGRDSIGNDIKEGKRSILVVYALEGAKQDEKTRLMGILNKPREETTNDDVLWVIDLFKRTGAIERAEKKAEELASRARQIISDFPRELREILEAMADYIVRRET